MADSNKEEKGTRSGVWFLCLIGVSLMLVGAVFGWLMFRSYQQAKQTREWPQVEAMVLRVETEERQISGSPREYRLNLMYGYEFAGRDMTTNRFSPRGSKWTKDESQVNHLKEAYPMGSTHTVWVDPLRPEAGILQHDTKAAGYTLWFPALFVLGGGGMIWGALRKRQTREE
ncbi:DUF3592 domain-containing protein [Verrucomicrobiaceae bacterium N1E253]|uniref:DUF3592 domain-containing protein n=1 Tax=Oceaniferula marina TaxID=2748318 RepID=A0A851GBA0_9BACT|nr:DUF3592 domain-containing protein [Oceaniferula marina]NWK54696.1 DUF3592 domain-containing protein [Oceaniferula marina]